MPLDYKIAEKTMANGLKVIVNEDHSVPNVTVNLWVNVGSRHEAPGRTGFAHLFEHLMFQGSRNVASGEHFSALMAVGGRLNATTWFDRTNYFETVPRGAMDLALWMEADRHGHLLDALNQESLDNQRDVVKEEKRQRYDNMPYGNALIDIYAAVFPKGHPYHHATIGSMADLDAASVEDVHEFFRSHYGPDNTVLALVGDLTPEEGFAAAERYFGSLPATADARRDPVEPLGPLSEPVRDEHLEDVPSDHLHLAFRLPVDDTPEFFAASLAMDIIGGLATSRLIQRLVRREQSATSVSAHAMGFVDGVSLGFIVVDVADGFSSDDVEAAVCEELVRFAEQGPSEIEMESAMAQTERGWLSSLASQEERADNICHSAMLQGDSGYINTFLDRLAEVTPAQVQQSAAKWLRPQSRAVVAYLKQDGDTK
ncbi:MAG: zinc protease [Actinomycetota bacterium]|jgi:predicted Zn-dependent peptidase|nr:zinc protease [Actinomycetota bacterium]